MKEIENRKYDLENRLVEFSLKIKDIVKSLPNTRTGNHLGGQLLRSGTSPLLNYAKAQGADSNEDFVHKLKICLKKLRETYVALKVIDRKFKPKPDVIIENVLNENSELISIFEKSILTAQKKK